MGKKFLREPPVHVDFDATQRVYETTLADMCGSFVRQSDYDVIKTALTDAYDVGVGHVTVGEDGGNIETYTRRGVIGAKLERGEIDAISVGWAIKVGDAKASLFTEPGVKFSLKHDTIEDLAKVQEFLTEQRDAGGFRSVLTTADRMSVYMGSSAVFVDIQNGHLRYIKINPGKLRFIWGDQIAEDGKWRPVDRLSIDEVSAVIWQIGAVDTVKFSYLAIVPANSKYPYGRYVTFVDGAECNEIPEPSTNPADNVFDYRLNPTSGDESDKGPVANPLTWFAQMHPEMEVPEIPISILHGGTTEDDVLMPTTDSLYRQGLAFDKKVTHLLDKVDEMAGGTTVIEREHTSTGQPLPRVISGIIALFKGQKINHIPFDTSGCKDAQEITREDMVHAAAAYEVPDFFVDSRDYTVDAASGRALDVKAKPLKKDRMFRADLNQPNVLRLFRIERAYIGFGLSDRAETATLLECTQHWDPGKLFVPEDKNLLARRVIDLGKAGILDVIGQIREYYQFSSDEEAMVFYDTMKARKAKYPPLFEEPPPKKPVGFLRGNRDGQQQQNSS